MNTGREFEIPAQFTKTAIGPNSFSTSSIAALTASLSVPSTVHPLAGAPPFSFFTNSIVSAVSLKSKAAIVAPVLAKLRQIPWPIPLAEPAVNISPTRLLVGGLGGTNDENDFAFIVEIGGIDRRINFLVQDWGSDHLDCVNLREKSGERVEGNICGLYAGVWIAVLPVVGPWGFPAIWFIPGLTRRGAHGQNASVESENMSS